MLNRLRMQLAKCLVLSWLFQFFWLLLGTSADADMGGYEAVVERIHLEDDEMLELRSADVEAAKIINCIINRIWECFTW